MNVRNSSICRLAQSNETTSYFTSRQCQKTTFNSRETMNFLFAFIFFYHCVKECEWWKWSYHHMCGNMNKKKCVKKQRTHKRLDFSSEFKPIKYFLLIVSAPSSFLFGDNKVCNFMMWLRRLSQSHTNFLLRSELITVPSQRTEKLWRRAQVERMALPSIYPLQLPKSIASSTGGFLPRQSTIRMAQSWQCAAGRPFSNSWASNI